MSETKVDNPEDTIEQQVEALLADVQNALKTAEERLESSEEEKPAVTAAEVTAPTPSEIVAVATAQTAEAVSVAQVAADQIAAMTPEPVETPAPDPAAPFAASVEIPAAAEEVVAEKAGEAPEKINAAVSAMVADASAAVAEAPEDPDAAPVPARIPAAASTASTPEPSVPTKPTANAASVEDLDSQLASLTEQLLSEPAPAMSVAAPIVVPKAPPTPAGATAAAVASKTTATVAPQEKAPAKSSPQILNGLSSFFLKALKALSSPLNKQPRIVRDTLGWVAIITLFWAMTIWGYMLFFHKPVESEVAEGATHIASETHGESSHGKSKHARIDEDKLHVKPVLGESEKPAAHAKASEEHSDSAEASQDPAHEPAHNPTSNHDSHKEH